MILQSQISKLSNRLFKEMGGKRIPENILERDYCIAWFLVGLSRTSLRNLVKTLCLEKIVSFTKHNESKSQFT
jgi:hypothetical protein